MAWRFLLSLRGTLLVVLGLVAATGGTRLGWGQEPLFGADFGADEVGAFPRTGWSLIGPPSSGLVEVARDEGDWFGQGTEAKYLRVRDGRGFTLRGELSSPSDVVSLRLRLIGRNSAEDNRWVNFNFFAGSGSERAHVFSMSLAAATIRNVGIPYGGNNRLLDISVLLNNSPGSISYQSSTDPSGVFGLAPARAAVWINGEQVIGDYLFARHENGTGPVRAISIQADTDAVVSFDLGRLQVFSGAVVDGEFVPVPPPPMVTIGDDGRLDYSEDFNGNRIPDFSNAGYMGGGVPIPDVPVALTLHPQAGDNRSLIQAAIDQVSAMPLNESGFRGAVLLTAGEYEVGNTLTISASGVVLRGEGDGPGGTVLRATGAFQHTLIKVAGSGSQWMEVSGTRRDVTDGYVPVGSRTFQVTDASGYEVGDTIIVYRPSTAEWISALGMDEIPPRSDGLPVTQWTAGSRDLYYDRIITAIDGNTITIDAPLANSLESQYGGGSIFRYTFPGRIAQVGIESIRAVSAYAGGAWSTSQFDENHAWSFIEMDRVQNAWVRNTTALHFAFGNTMVNRLGKWITIQDSQNLFPVSKIEGSRRYPFYLNGQLSLVQRCYANYARHDYGTSSLTHGPNVFLDSSGDYSYSDTGPHHRWATGSLYDNIRVPNRDIAIQNRLNMGSGHGWAGANHVVWNSSANRIVVQNPPTAQNWAIGVIGTKWAGAFPNYASDGYWISHGIPVEPASLYLKQLEDRLAPEGSGGAIATVSFYAGATSATVEPGGEVRFPVSRRGNRDGMANVHFILEGEAAEWIDAPDAVLIPAQIGGGYLALKLREEVKLLDKRTVEVRLVHGPGYSVGTMNTATITIPASPLGAWRADHFTEEQRADPSVSGLEAVPAGDGLENLLKYALDLPPFIPAAGGDLPEIALVDGRLTLTFARGDSRTDIDYVTEVSGDLKTWESGAEATEEVSVIGDSDWKRVTVADRTPFTAAERRFIRLRIRLIE